MLNIEVSSAQLNTKVTKLADLPLKYMLPVGEHGKGQKLYEFNDHYLSQETAKKDLIKDIYLHPERYVSNKKLLISIMDKDIPYLLPSQIANANICASTSNDNNCINQGDYDSQLSEEKDKFLDQIFDQYFEPNKRTYFLDGFGHYFETRQEVLTSLDKNIAKSNFQISYYYQTRTGKDIIINIEEEIVNLLTKMKLLI